MNRRYRIYSTGCPRCRVLEKKMEQLNIDFEVVEDENKMIELGFTEAPMLEDLQTNKFYTFEEAIIEIRAGSLGTAVGNSGCPSCQVNS